MGDKSQFANGVELYETTRVLLEQVTGEFVKVAAEWGLTVSLEETNLLAMGKTWYL